MFKKLISSSTVHPFLHPLDIRTPLRRLDFWIFYCAYILLTAFSVGWIEVLSAFVDPGSPIGLTLGALVLFIGLLWLIYLFVALLAATARRMLDSGYRRLGLGLSLLLNGMAMAAIFVDAWMAYHAARAVGQLPETVSYSAHTMFVALAAFLSLIYVFLGTIRPSRKAQTDTESEA